MTSVALMTAVTLSPFFSPISSALRFVMTDSTTLSPTLSVMTGHGAENNLSDFAGSSQPERLPARWWRLHAFSQFDGYAMLRAD
jgi:hypothetical protein